MSYDQIDVPEVGEQITLVDEETGELNVPETPIIPIIYGDGIGSDVGPAAQQVLDAAAEATGRSIAWMRLYAGGSAREKYDENLPQETVDAIREHGVAIKGPLTTPVGAGFRSLNVSIRQELDLYACVRPVKYIEPIPSPMKDPGKINMIVFRENTEDLYAGIEWEAGSVDAEKVRRFLADEMGVHLPEKTGLGVKPISEKNTRRLVAKAVQYAIDNQLASVTLMHKGNIMKYTEGAFCAWGYQAAREIFGEAVLTEAELYDQYNGVMPEAKVLIKDRISDMLFQQI